jgi:acyl carrier protein
MEADVKFDETIFKLIAEGVQGKFKKAVITPDTNLQKDLGLDSIGMLSLVFRFEESFGIDIAQLGVDVNVAKLKTVRDLLRTGRELIAKAQAAGIS